MCALHVSPLPMFRSNAMPSSSFSAAPSRSRPEQFPHRRIGDQFSTEPFAKRRRMELSPVTQDQPLQPPMRSYPSSASMPRPVQYSGSYPDMKTLDQRSGLYRTQRHPFDDHTDPRTQRHVAPEPPRGRRVLHATTGSSLPGVSSLLSSSGSPPPHHHPQRRPVQRPAPHTSDSGPMRIERNVSWSSNGSPTESPLVSRGAAVAARPPHWGAAIEAATATAHRDSYGPYYQQQQRLSESHLRDQYRHSLATTTMRPTMPTTTTPLGATGSASPSSVSGDELVATRVATASGSKNSRYLREMDRRAILERLANGEKQAALAKEFQVSRAAICNLNKHRDEVMSRADENPFAKHPKKRKVRSLSTKATSIATVTSTPTTSTSTSSTPSTADEQQAATNGTASAVAAGSVAVPAPCAMAAVHVVQSRAVQLLMTTLRSHVTPPAEFRRCSERVMRLVIEDALALVPSKPVDVYLNDQVKVEGVGLEHAPCGISMEQRHCPMMDMFHLIEPDQPTGYVRIDGARGNDVSLLDAHLPASLRFHNVFLFDLVAASSETLCATIQQLKDRGAVESMVHVVALFVSSDVVASVQCTFPGVHIVTAQIDASLGKKKSSRGAGLESVLTRFAQVYSDAV